MSDDEDNNWNISHVDLDVPPVGKEYTFSIRIETTSFAFVEGSFKMQITTYNMLDNSQDINDIFKNQNLGDVNVDDVRPDGIFLLNKAMDLNAVTNFKIEDFKIENVTYGGMSISSNREKNYMVQ